MLNLDFFRQPRSDKVKSTVHGGIISLLSLALLMYGVFIEVNNFVGTTVDVEVTVENHPMASHNAILELNLTVFDVACTLLNPMLTSETSEIISSVESNFVKTRIVPKDDGSGYEWIDERDIVNRLESSQNDEQFTTIYKEIKKAESCNMYARLIVPKTEGSITIASIVNPIVFILASELGHNTDMKNHKFHSLKFTNGAQGLIDEEGDTLFASMFDYQSNMFERLNDVYSKNDKGMVVTYFAEVVPHVLYDEFYDRDLYSLTYSLNHHGKHDPLTSGITLSYDFSPLTMRMVKKNKPIGKMAINI